LGKCLTSLGIQASLSLLMVTSPGQENVTSSSIDVDENIAATTGGAVELEKMQFSTTGGERILEVEEIFCPVSHLPRQTDDSSSCESQEKEVR